MRGSRMGDRHDGVLPRARTAGLIIQELPDETLVYDQQRHRAHCLNPVAACVWRRCDGVTTFPVMEQLLGAELHVPVGADVVHLALQQLADAQLLAEPPVDMDNSVATLSRRALLTKIGVGVAAAVCIPLVTSIVAPTPAQAGSLIGTGGRTYSAGGEDCVSGAQFSGYCL